MSYTLPELPYGYDALEPYISKEIMILHHTKHHQTYITNLNAALQAYQQTNDIKQQIALQSALKFNGGGYLNHVLFFNGMAPASSPDSKLQEGSLKAAIEADFGSFEDFKKKFNTATLGVQGSGWGWLGYNSATKHLEIATTANQDPLITLTPIIGLDIWEHAFYLQYKNVKPDYLAAYWNVCNFAEAQRRFDAAVKA